LKHLVIQNIQIASNTLSGEKPAAIA